MVTTEKRLPDYYFDDTDPENLYGFPVTLPNPTRAERKEMEVLASFNRGVMLVTGKAGSGKETFGVPMSYQNKRFWDRPILLDFKPRRLFGEYTYFDPIVMSKEIDRMAKSASLDNGNPDEELSQKQESFLRGAAEEWMVENETILKGSILYLSELRRYCYNRNPHNRVNKAIGALCTQWRHLDMLIIGTHIQEHEIDQYTFKGNVTHWVTSNWMLTKLNTTEAVIRRGAFLSEYGNFDLRLPPIKITVDGGVPRSFLTKPDTLYNITPAGKRLLEKNGKEIQGTEILAYLNNVGQKEGQQIAVKFGASQEEFDGVISYLVEQGLAKGNRWFDLWNSKNKVNLRPSIKGAL